MDGFQGKASFEVDFAQFDWHGDGKMSIGSLCHDLNGFAYKLECDASQYRHALDQREAAKPGSVTKHDLYYYEQRRLKAKFLRDLSTWLWNTYSGKKP